MPNLKDIRKRISSVKNTQKITRAMKMVAAAKLRRSTEAVVKLRPYAKTISRVALGLIDSVDRELHPLLRQKAAHNAEDANAKKKVMLIAITADRGLCGAYNSAIQRKGLKFYRDAEAAGNEIEIGIVGRKGNEFFKNRKIEINYYYDNAAGRPVAEVIEEIAAPIIERFISGDLDEIHILHTQFLSAMNQESKCLQLLPLLGAVETELGAGASTEAIAIKKAEMSSSSDYLYEPSQKEALNALLPRHLQTQIRRAFLESLASEQGARMSAMDNATTNANDMIDKLSLIYNRARQAAITTELSEIISGAEAL